MVKVSFAYERLPFFCFLCGMIGHGEKECSNVDDDEEERSMGWVKYLRATPCKGTQRRLEEIEEVTTSRRVLFVTKPVKLSKELPEGEAVGGNEEDQVGEVGRDTNGEGEQPEAGERLISGVQGVNEAAGKEDEGVLEIMHGPHANEDEVG